MQIHGFLFWLEFEADWVHGCDTGYGQFTVKAKASS